MSLLVAGCSAGALLLQPRAAEAGWHWLGLDLAWWLLFLPAALIGTYWVIAWTVVGLKDLTDIPYEARSRRSLRRGRLLIQKRALTKGSMT